jgi:hypothetical protein
MKSLFARFFSVLAIFGVFAVVAACGDDNGDQPTQDTGGDVADVSEVADAGADVDDTGDDADVELDAGDTSDAIDYGFLCQPCADDSECGGADDRCLQMPAGDQACTQSCDPDAENPCPGEFICATVNEVAGIYQCVPPDLTCADRCSDADCADGEICDPWTGSCIEPLGVCDTGCTTASICGDGPEDFCVGMPGTENPDGSTERACLTGCNPQAETSECPVNFFCSPTSDEPEPTEGICFPLESTCVDRCADADCAAGENCNALTGQCEAAQFGFCETGCTNSAQCGGQNDICLNLGIDDAGAHCWQDCSDDPDICTENYGCQRLRGTTVSLCLPTGQTCGACDDTSCYPGGVCDPTNGECVDLIQDCTQAGCPSGKLCDPVSTECVAPGRECSGSTWASSCDNVVTACTTRIPDTAGTCEEICTQDNDCPSGESCVDTNLRRLCLPDDLGGPITCGTLSKASTDVGAPCGPGRSCSGGANICVQEGNLAGFCSRSCTADADCDAGQSCAPGPGGMDICIPAQCQCAATPSMSSALTSAWSSALGAIDTSQCDLWLEPSVAETLPELAQTPLSSSRLVSLIEFPMSAVEAIADEIAALDAAQDTPTAAIEAGATALGLTVSGAAQTYTYPGAESKLTQAVSQLITQAGGTPNTTQLETDAQNVPADFQDVAAPIISATADALAARNSALQQAGWSASTQTEAFDGAPYLLLPGTTAQLAAKLDLSSAATAAAYDGFPVADFAQAAADLSATIEQASAAVNNSTIGWTGFMYVVDTPAGKVVLGDAGDTVYDPATNSALAGDIAVIIDAGGNDTYRLPVAANQSVANGVAIVVDMDGSDTYTYAEVSDPNDTADTLPSDADGRKVPAGPLNLNDGPVSLSTTARQGAGRLGIGLLIDQGAQDDTYRSLRMSQGAAVFGVGLLFDDGGVDSYDAEAFAQGAAMKGIGVLWDVAGDDDYRVWHAGQGFGTASGAGILSDVDGADDYEAVTGQTGGAGVLYLSLSDRGRSNANLAQGAGVGVEADGQSVGLVSGLGGGLGILRDRAGLDTYTAGTFAQGFGSVRGIGVLADAAGDDVYDGRGVVQGVGELFAGGVFLEEGGAEQYNQNTAVIRPNGQGTGRTFGWGFFHDAGGDNTATYMTPGGGAGLDGGFGFAFFAAGADTHASSSPSTWGFANNSAVQGAPLDGVLTVGVFLDAGANTDTYTRPGIDPAIIADDLIWLQPAMTPLAESRGVGVDE